MDTYWFDFIILPLLIFTARIFDVSLDTIRVIMVSKGYRKLAPYIGFFQVLIWIITITRIMENLDNWITYVAYAAGFAMGTYVGMWLEERLAIGNELLRVITRKPADELIKVLRDEGFVVTVADGMGRDGEVGILFLVVKRKALKNAVALVKKYNPQAYYTIEDMRFVRNPEFITPSRRENRRMSRSR
jgi:uncharacterized protein YebE (UPF0316 family)